MNVVIMKRPYLAPIAEAFTFPKTQSLLVSFSVEGGLEDFEEGGEI